MYCPAWQILNLNRHAVIRGLTGEDWVQGGSLNIYCRHLICDFVLGVEGFINKVVISPPSYRWTWKPNKNFTSYWHSLTGSKLKSNFFIVLIMNYWLFRRDNDIKNNVSNSCWCCIEVNSSFVNFLVVRINVVENKLARIFISTKESSYFQNIVIWPMSGI